MSRIKYKILGIIFLAVCLFGCRDYISGIGENEPSALYTDETTYGIGEPITVYLRNNSLASVYVKGAFQTLEKYESGSWNEYSNIFCSGGCPEFAVASKRTISDGTAAGNAGIYRFVGLYSFSPNSGEEEKIKIYSNEFTVQ